MLRFRSPVVWVCAIAIGATTSCSTGTPRQTKLMKTTNMTISASELRVQVRSLAGRFSGLMEEAGEAAVRRETDPAERRKALLWLTNGIPAMQQALFQPDPVAAMLDAWFLVAQMRDYFERKAPNLAPENYNLAIHALDEMEGDLRIIVENAGPEVNYEKGRQLVYSTAENNPLDHSFASRRGSTVFLARFTEETGGGALRSIGSITETVEDLVARIDLNAEYIPKLARWQAMLFALEGGYENIPESVRNLEYIEFIASEVERLSPLVESLPVLVAEERVAVLEALDAYLMKTLGFMNQQRRVLMTEELRFEREAVMASVREERIATLETLAEERRIILEAISHERAAVFDDLDHLMDEAFTREANKLFVRGMVLVAMILAGFAAITFLGVRALKRERE